MPIETRVSHDGLVWISGNYYSIPDHTRRIVEVQQLPDVIPFSIKPQSLPSIPFWRRPPANSRRARASTGGQPVQVATWRIRSPRRSGRRSHRQAGRWGFTKVSQTAPPIGRPAITMHAQPAATDNVRKGLVALKMPRALRMLDSTCGELKEGEVTWIEALDHAYRGADGARQSPCQHRAENVSPDHRQNPRWLRLRIPAVARSQSHSGACRIEIHLLATPPRAISRRHSRSRP